MHDASIALSLLLITLGCGSDGGGSRDATTGASSSEDGEESTGGSSATDASTGAADSSSGGDTSSGPGDTADASTGSTGGGGTCGGIECGPEEQCVEDACVPIPTCEAPVDPSHPDCAPCIARQCCDVVQACFGDGSAREPTSCADLSVCVDEQCAESETLEEFEACVFDGCGATQDDYDALLATFSCVGECVAQVGLGREESCSVSPQ